MCPFFLVIPLNVLFLEEVTNKNHENQQANHEQIKIKLSTLKRSSFFVLCLVFTTFKEQVDKLNLDELAKLS